MQDKKALIDQIIEIELEMFLTVPTGEKSICQDDPDSFRLHRSALFIVWTEDTLKSYLKDLSLAREQGVNLMTLKYARMDDLISRNSTNPLIDEIASIQYRWQQEMFRKYPHLMANARPLSETENSSFGISFESYMKAELETYSDSTLSHLFSDITQKLVAGINMSEEVYEYLVKKLGYESIEAADQFQMRSERKFPGS